VVQDFVINMSPHYFETSHVPSSFRPSQVFGPRNVEMLATLMLLRLAAALERMTPVTFGDMLMSPLHLGTVGCGGHGNPNPRKY